MKTETKSYLISALMDFYNLKQSGTYAIYMDMAGRIFIHPQRFKGGYLLSLGKDFETVLTSKNEMISWLVNSDKKQFGQSFDEFCKVFDVASEVSGIYVGTWYDEQKEAFYIEFSQKEIHLSDAIRKGKEREQKAVFDCKNNKSITL